MKLWTDYNTHDPGITILEQLCYAITDLSYRLDFEMKDLLAPAPGDVEINNKQFFTAREILTVNPLTINDYRKLLIDIDGVKNAWVKPIKNSEPPIYYDSLLHTLTFEASKRTQQVNLNGLYRVLIEKEKNVSDEAGEEILKKNVKYKLNQHRNLCEDFVSVDILKIETISVKAEIEIEEGFDVNKLMAKLYFELDNFISPHLHFFTLKELLNQGKAPEAIFDGVPLEHGFLDNEQLDSFIKKDQLHTSDLIRIILDIPGIKTVRSITISSDKSSESEEWALALEPNLTPQLKDIDGLTSNITFYKGQISCNLNLAKAKSHLESLQQQNTKTPSIKQTKDIPIPVGQYRELSDYESIQNDFPATYGIGEIGLPASASPKRKAQAKQLQAYLMFFDKLLADYFAQLDHAKDLFSFQTKNKTTYFSQDLSNLPGAAEVLNPESNSPTDKWNETDLARRNRFLDHLMAQFCEKFTDYSLLLYDSILEEELIDDKISFLQNYPQISAGRGKAFNYTDSSQVWDTENVSGLKQRICSLLGIPYHRKTLALCNELDETEGFHIVEHILLRPRSSNDPDSDENFLEFKSNTDSNTDSNTIDPYSFQISFVFPNWLPRFQEENFKQLIYNIISAEIPAHITPYCYWLDKPNMINFENAYQLWLNTKMDKKSTNNLIEFLVNGRLEILPFKVLGYMTIGTDFEVEVI
ncbi:MAG: hypothetical protein F6K37_32810 [Moorea sp. SIO4E2]|uniref:hypothetical protein n=1 Tax=Moorena sp. SIO4E2 TaxID=2607826 RepID=UPI0013B91E10|nr:hypothetical protein [Moorena sp. SIO4E2]NEQ10530.1 hypothetical protein [Moorena sp. SIO4E2]